MYGSAHTYLVIAALGSRVQRADYAQVPGAVSLSSLSLQDVGFSLQGPENASLLLESRISRKPSVGVRSSQERKPAAWGCIRVSQAVKDKADKVLNFCR